MILHTLPLDVLLHVFRFLAIDDILSMRAVSKALFAVTLERSVWADALLQCIVAEGLPVPGIHDRHVSLLSSSELENITRRSMRLHRNWNSARPIPTRQTQLFPVVTSTPSRGHPRVLALYSLPGRGNDYLISITVEDQAARPRTYDIDCWRVSASSRVARYQCSNLFSAAVNADASHPCVIAVTRKTVAHLGNHAEGDYSTSTFGIDLTTPDSRSAFDHLMAFPSVKHAVALKGSRFLATEESHSIRVFDVNTGCLQYMLRTPLINDDPTIVLDEFRCLNSVIFDDFILVFRHQFIHLYMLPPQDASAYDPTDVAPTASYKWQWRIDTLMPLRKKPHPVLSQLRSDTHPDANLPTPICILLRFDSWFPWPVNILHQFILPVNPLYKHSLISDSGDGTPRSDSHTLSELPYLARPSTRQGEEPFSADSVGTHLRPYPVSSMPSPIRIFTPSDTALGSFGTAMWLDAHTDGAAPAQAGDRGQRVAAKTLRFHPPSHGGMLPRHAVELDAGNGFAQPDDESESPVVVFNVQEENDNWVKLAVCDEEGWVAIGCTDGRILVYEYA